MCYNCGCGMPNDDHGRGHAGAEPEGKAITDKTFEEAAKAYNLTKQQAKENVLDSLEEELSEE